MTNFTDKQYYARSEGRIAAFREFLVGSLTEPQPYITGDIVTRSTTDGDTGVITTVYHTALLNIAGGVAFDASQWEIIDQPVEGSNRFLTLANIIDNYVVLYSDDTNHMGMVKRMKVEAFAKRSIQEFSYDTLRIKDLEYEIVSNPRIVMPQDFVEMVNINYIDRFGKEQWLVQRLDSSNPRSAAQDEDGNYAYDSSGNIVSTYDTSISKQRWDGESNNRNLNTLSQYTTEGGFYTYGKRYYLDTEVVNSHPTFYINERDGVIDLDPSLLPGNSASENLASIITMKYVSDGMSEDPSEIQVHKFAEQAIYEMIYFEMIARSGVVPGNEKERAKRRMVAKKREAKLRLSKISPREMIQTFRAQAGWIHT